jgi:SNF2 family DNA or RNA helicase
MLCSHSSLIEGEYPHNLSSVNEGSEKITVVKNTLSDIYDKNEKVLIFTKFKKMQRVLQELIIKEYCVSPGIINGDMSENRQVVVDHFNSSLGFNVLILSPKAGGVGLNITGANHVIHYTREWNPAIENQATDRVYRIGQKKDVHVYYPITIAGGSGSVEEKLDELLIKKQELFENTIVPIDFAKINAEDFSDVLLG